MPSAQARAGQPPPQPTNRRAAMVVIPESERPRRRRRSDVKWRTNPVIEGREQIFAHGYLPISRISEAQGRPGRARSSVSELINEAAFDKLFAEQIQALWRDYNARALSRIRISQ